MEGKDDIRTLRTHVQLPIQIVQPFILLRGEVRRTEVWVREGVAKKPMLHTIHSDLCDQMVYRWGEERNERHSNGVLDTR